MSNRHWMPLYPSDYLADTVDLTAEQHGVYLLLLIHLWRRSDCRFPDDLSFIRRLLPPMHGHSFNRLAPPILTRFFQLEDGCWTHKRVAKERQKADKLSLKQSQNAHKRWAAHKEINDLVDAAAYPKTIPLQLQLQPQKKEGKKERVSARKRASPKIPFPSDWIPKDGIQGQEGEFENMKDWALANGILKADWEATWRTWKRRAPEFKKGGNGNIRSNVSDFKARWEANTRKQMEERNNENHQAVSDTESSTEGTVDAGALSELKSLTVRALLRGNEKKNGGGNLL